MKIIFLDFDGVLNSQDYLEKSFASNIDYKIDGHLGLDPTAISRLNRLANAGFKFVISSSWRVSYKKSQLVQLLINRGFIGEVIGATPIMLSNYRGSEIKQWLDCWVGDPITSFAILDDGNDMDPYMDRLVQTEFERGLQDNHIEIILSMKEIG